MVIFTYTPVGRLKAVNEWLEDAVDDDVQRGDSVLRDFTEKHIIIIAHVRVDGLARWSGPYKVEALPL